MERPRVRWKNVGRLAAGIGAGGLLIGVVPGVLEPAAPAPLPPDVGLMAGPAGRTATPPASGRTSEEEHQERDHEPAGRPADPGPPAGKPKPFRPRAQHAQAPPAPARPTVPTAGSSPAAAEVAAAPSAPSSAPEPVEAPEPEPEPDHEPEVTDQPPAATAEFGFER
jgi:hypothetical protein